MADLFDELIKSVDDLSEDQVEELLSKLAVKRKHIELQKKIKDIEIHDIACIHCGSVDIRKHGKKNNRQRYFCKDCGKTFTNSTGSVMFHSRLSIEQWKELLRGIVENLSVREIAKNIGTSPTTVWYNKQKVCNALMSLYGKQDGFVDIAECDEYYTTLSFKGKRDPNFFINTLGRMPRHHRTYQEKVEYLMKHGFWAELQDTPEKLEMLLESSDTYMRGISNDQTCILTCRDRNANLYINQACIGRLETADVKKHLGGRFADDAILVTDSHNAYNGFASDERVQLEQIESGKHSKGAYNLGRINALHSRLAKYWPRQEERLPATKYADLGLILFWWLEKNSHLSVREKVNALYDIVTDNIGIENSNYEDITNRELSLNTKGLIPSKV